MVTPQLIVVFNSDHTRPEEVLWSPAESDAHAKLSPTGSVVNCCVQGSVQSIDHVCSCLGPARPRAANHGPQQSRFTLVCSLVGFLLPHPSFLPTSSLFSSCT